MICVIEGCGGSNHARGWCQLHYQRWRNHGTTDSLVRFVNPLVCVCAKPVADPARDFGMCQVCKRKPLALMAPRVELAVAS